MIKAHNVILSMTIVAASALKEGQLVRSDGNPTGADGLVLGVAGHDADFGETVTLNLFGIVDMIAGNEIARDAALSSNANGLPISGGSKPFGRALNAARPGGRVSVLLLPK